MSLTLRQLEVFLAAAQDCSFRRTAERLGISQPSVSGRIKSIEAYLGYDLFDRSSGIAPRLTIEGRSFVEKAHQLMSCASQLSPERATRTRAPLRLKVFVGPWLFKLRVVPALSKFCYENTSIDADFEPLSVATEGRDLVHSGEADVVVYTGDLPDGDGGHVGDGTETQIITTTGCSIFGTPELLARLERSGTPLEAAPFILPPEHHPPGRWVRQRLAATGIVPSNVIATPQFPDLVIQMMLDGRGLTVFYDESLRGERALKTGPALAPASRVMVIGTRALRPAAAPLLDFLRTVSRSGEAPCP
jgi:DNA-binding transcriptional LysR family regulator